MTAPLPPGAIASPEPRAPMRVLDWVLCALLALLPLSVSVTARWKVAVPALLFLGGLGLLARAPVRRAYRAAGPVVAVALASVATDLLNILLHGLGWRPFDHAAHVLLYLVIAAAFVRPPRLQPVWAGLSLTALLLGGTCLVQHYLLGIDRPYGLNGGASASIECAIVLLTLALMATVRLLHPATGRVERVIHASGLLVGLYGALLTQSRGPLLAFVPVFVGVLLVHARRGGNWRALLGLTALTCLVGAGALATMRGELLERFQAIDHEVATYDARHDAQGAVRERLEMWRTAWRAFTSHPLGGIGLDRYQPYVRAEIAAGRSNPSISHYNQPHNEYLRAMVDGGIGQLAVLLLVFGVPLAWFVRRLDDPDPEAAALALAGVAVVLMYAFCALGESVLYRVMTQSVYFFLVLGLAVRLGRCRAPLRADSPAAAATA